MTKDEIKAFVRSAFVELLEKGNVAAAPNYIAEDVTFPTPRGLLPGLAGVGQYFGWLLGALHNMRVEVIDTIVDGDRAAALSRFEAVHAGEFRGVPPTGQTVTWTGVSWVRIADGKMVQITHHYNHLGVLEQLGAIPTLTFEGS